MEKRYRALRFLARIYQILGILIGIIVLVAVIGSCVALAVGGGRLGQLERDFNWRGMGGIGVIEGTLAAVIGGVIAILYGGIAALTLYAVGEAIMVLLAMEENTRATTSLLRQGGGQPAAPRPEPEPLQAR